MKMRIEKNVSERKGKEYYYSESKKNKRRQRMMMMMSPVQKLYDTCKQVFVNCAPGVVPCADNLERLKAVLDNMTEADVGLTPNLPYFKSTSYDKPPKITYLHLHECDKFSCISLKLIGLLLLWQIGIFCLPPSAVIPLHDHPGMTVFSKLLFGDMHIKSYDWVDKLPAESIPNANPLDKGVGDSTGLRLAKVKVNSEHRAPCKTSILYPADGGNMHCFTARTACAVLDVLGPPYCDPEGRHCQYYSDFPVTNISVPEEQKGDYAWLKEREKPDDLTVVGALYRGPKIVK